MFVSLKYLTLAYASLELILHCTSSLIHPYVSRPAFPPLSPLHLLIPMNALQVMFALLHQLMEIIIAVSIGRCFRAQPLDVTSQQACSFPPCLHLLKSGLKPSAIPSRCNKWRRSLQT